ncbi:MAG: hypothetical protein SFU27_12070 [Thermonemataceae bacterium]|nr:hypothetical protein [Thermonemataceae bacterium]
MKKSILLAFFCVVVAWQANAQDKKNLTEIPQQEPVVKVKITKNPKITPLIGQINEITFDDVLTEKVIRVLRERGYKKLKGVSENINHDTTKESAEYVSRKEVLEILATLKKQ